MTWIALKMLVGDKAKFFGIVLGLMFAAMLITQQGSIFCGLMARTAGQVYDLKGADLWVMDANVRFIDDVKPMIENSLYRVRGVEGVEWAVPLYKGNGRVKLTSYSVDAAGRPILEDAEPTAPPEPTTAARVKARLSGLPIGWFEEIEPTRRTYAAVDEPIEGSGPAYADRDGSPGRFVPARPEGRGVDLRQSIHQSLRSIDRAGELRPVRPIRHDVIEQVILLGLDDASMIGAPPPERIIVGSLEDLRKPDAILVDYNRLPKLFPGEPWHLLPPEPKWTFIQDRTDPGWKARYEAERRAFYARFVGRDLEMNDHRAVIVGICEASRTFQSNAVVYTTYSRAKQFVPRERKFLSYVLAKVETPSMPASAGGEARPTLIDRLRSVFQGDPAELETERRRKLISTRIQAQTGLKARTSNEFIWDTIHYFLVYTGIPINFGITAFLGFVVGTAIAGQTFYLFTVDNLKQFGALKAMGATNLRIVRMILTQAVVVGTLGYGLGVGLAAYFGESSKGGELAFYTPWQLLPITAAAIVLICALASVVSVRKVVVLEPAVVFRG